jgi:phosphatidylserine decarboxylase
VVKYFKFIKDDSPATWYSKPAKIKEQTTIAIETTKGSTILLKQTAGSFANCIVCYASEGKGLKQGEDLGFIKFGSKVYVLLPKSANINVKIGDLVKGNETIIAKHS